MAEEVIGIVLGLDLLEPRVLIAVGRADGFVGGGVGEADGAGSRRVRVDGLDEGVQPIQMWSVVAPVGQLA